MEENKTIETFQINQLKEQVKQLKEENADLKQNLKLSQEKIKFLQNNINEMTSSISQDNIKSSAAILTITEINKLKYEIFALQ